MNMFRKVKLVCKSTFKNTVDFEGKRYDVGDKLGFLQATVEMALKREELRDDFIKYLETKPWENK